MLLSLKNFKNFEFKLEKVWQKRRELTWPFLLKRELKILMSGF